MEAISDDEVTRRLFDSEAQGYDHLNDLNDAWLFSRIHYFITRYVIAQWDRAPKDILDVGCGTGFQSFLYASVGARVTGIDISPGSLSVASQKAEEFKDFARARSLVPYFSFVRRYNRRISRLIQNKTWQMHRAPTFQLGDARQLPFAAESFDHINCCGSVLNYVNNHLAALSEMSRVLRKGGTFSIEVRRNYNIGLLCALIMRSLRLSWSYSREVTRHFTSTARYLNEHTKIPLTGEHNRLHFMLFAKKKFAQELAELSLQPLQTFDILSIINLIPVNILRRARPSIPLRLLFLGLAAIEGLLPVQAPGRKRLIYREKRQIEVLTKIPL